MRVFKEEIENYLRGGENLLPYPEGSRNYKDQEIRDFKPGMFGPLIEIVNEGREIYIVPMKIYYDKRVEEKFIPKIEDYKRRRDACLGNNHKIKSKIYDSLYFWTDVYAYLHRSFEKEKGNAYLIFGKAFNDYDKNKKHLVAERAREEIMELKL